MSVSVISSNSRQGRHGAHPASRAVLSCFRITFGATLIWLLLATGTAQAENIYQEPNEFIAEAFSGAPPAPQVLWLTGPLRNQVQTILDHPPAALRIRYWTQDGRSAWVLEEIGKERPITVGIVVNSSGIERIKVLVFRESRGWEVRYPFFTDQFHGAALDRSLALDRHIDGISGATLSVRALKKLARVALLLHGAVQPTS